jgi:hypothetical protein
MFNDAVFNFRICTASNERERSWMTSNRRRWPVSRHYPEFRPKRVKKAFENTRHNGWHRSYRGLLEDRFRASETCSLQREIRLQSLLNITTEGLIGLPWEAGIYWAVQEITCWSEKFRWILWIIETRRLLREHSSDVCDCLFNPYAVILVSGVHLLHSESETAPCILTYLTWTYMFWQ